MNIEKTGHISDDFYLYQTLYLSEKEFHQLTIPLEELASKHDCDFIVVYLSGKINFLHFTNGDNLSAIEDSNKLIPSKHIGDLGVGVYAVPAANESFHEEGISNILTYFEDYEEDSIGKISGSYDGCYGLTVFGFQHEGYLLLKEGVITIEDTHLIDITDFLMNT